ncbi:MAG: quinoprotein dehydrogenase-associated SoxYZ-like carrier [Burkholderiales bacterium]
MNPTRLESYEAYSTRRHLVKKASPKMVLFLPRCCCSLIVAMGLLAGGTQAQTPVDPVGERGRWADMQRQFYRDGEVTFDPRVRVDVPGNAEDAMNVPVAVDARALAAEEIDRIVVVADYNPILKVLEFEPGVAAPYLAFRMKVQQTTPIRAGVRLKDGRWRVGSAVVASQGGGCTAPSTGRSVAGWERTLNSVSARQFESTAGNRLRFSILHPMDTGLANGIPAFFIDELSIRDAEGRVVARIWPAEPVSENPVFTLELGGVSRVTQIEGRDNNGNKVLGALR